MPTTLWIKSAGTMVSLYPILSASRRSRSGVLPPRTTLRRQGPSTRRGMAAISSKLCGASMNAMSAPAAKAAFARAIASSKPATARASVRAMIMNLVAASGDSAADLRQIILSRDDLFTFEMAAPLRKFLILDMNGRYPAALEFTHGAKDVELVAVAGIGIGEDRHLDRGRNAPGIGHHLRHGNE